MTTAVVKKEEFGMTEVQQGMDVKAAGEASAKQHEMQAAIIVAKKFPRDEAQAFAKLMHAAKRPSFAEDATYAFPRGGAQVTGPSVNIAREAARVWGNIRYGLEVLRDDGVSRQIRGWAWDMESNTKVEAEDDFRKLVYRKQGGWIEPDERDLRELTNRRGAILIRNCILQLLPKDLIEDAIWQCGVTLKDRAAKDPDADRKRLVVNFAEYNITPEMIAKKLGHPLTEATPDEMVELQGIYTSIKDGTSTWREYTNGGDEGKEPSGVKDKLKEQLASEQAKEPLTTTLYETDTDTPVDREAKARELVKALTATPLGRSVLGPIMKNFKIKDSAVLPTSPDVLTLYVEALDEAGKRLELTKEAFKA
jgi:hypothetical protein